MTTNGDRSRSPRGRGGAKEFDGMIAAVTGGAGGLGLMTARTLCTRGATVSLLDTNAEALSSAVAELKKDGHTKVHSFQVNLTKEEEVKTTFAKIKTEVGVVDILVQAAGITGVTNKKTHEVDAENFNLVFAVNSTAIFLCAKQVIPGMLEKNYGRIVNIASISGKEGNAGMLAYSASKASVIGITKVMGKEYAETGLTVNCIAPAVVRTKMVAAMPAQQVTYMTDKIPMKRCGTEKEIADMICFIASKEASFTTAFCFDATGGRATY